MKKEKLKELFQNKIIMTAIIAVLLVVLFFVTFMITNLIIRHVNTEKETTEYIQETTTVYVPESTTEEVITTAALTEAATTKTDITTKPAETTVKQETTVAATTDYIFTGTLISYPSSTSEWELICLNRNRRVSADTEKKISLSNVAGTQSKMDSRAAQAYNRMYDAAASENIYLTPCSGYRSYSRQKYLFDEYVNEYLQQGKSREDAELLASNRRNPPGSSEHNIGICMDIICAATSANFQNTKEYAWLCENAADYGFILRYPEDKTSITGVKFEPWHWRYVGTENAAKIKASGLCLEEYLGLA